MTTPLNFSSGRGLDLPNAKDVFAQNTVIKDTLDLLKEGEKEIELDEKYKDVIMILGNTGSGKSTFTQWLAGDDTKLISKETEEGTGEYIIEGPGIGNSSLKSETIFPELVIDAETNAAYYDCPGFSDTQGTSHEIAETYFIKKVLDFSESLKMIFAISHTSVRKGVDREGFMKLVRHVTDLVKDTAKFKHSIAMVATKVDNQYIKQGEDFVLVEDKKVIAAIAGFLQKEVKQYLEDNSKRPNLTDKENRFYENAITFVEVLLEKEGETYPRIGIFRRPDRPGPVSDIPLLQNGKQHIEKIVYEKLNFTAKDNEDFGYTVSEKTKNDINEIIEEINKNLWSTLSNISGKIQEYCENLVERVRGKIHSFVSEINVVDADPSEAKTFRYEFISAYNSSSELVNKTSNLKNPEELAVIVNTTTSNLNIDIPEDEILYIATQGNYFTFLQTVSDKELGSRPWDQVFKDVETFLSASKTNILQDVDSAAKNINDRIQINLNGLMKEIHEEYIEKIKSLEIQKLSGKLNEDYHIILESTEEIKNETTTEKLVKATRYIANNLKISLPEENLQNVANQGKYLKFLEIMSERPLNIDPMMWLHPFENLAKYFYEYQKWYAFVEDLYNKFSEYDIQKDRQRYNVADLEDWGQPGKPQGIYVTSNTFKEFLQKIRNFNVKEYETIKDMTEITDLQTEELNQALSLTLKHRSTVRCSGTHINVKGSFILLDETMKNLMSNSDTNNSCNNFKDDFPDGKYTFLKLFALKNVFIDTDLSFAGKRISVAVIAPKWEVLESRSIELHGVDGDPKKKAKNGAHPGNDGFKGVPGDPGGSAESFFGIGSAFVDGANLKITANGGQGGVGQEGGDGAAGVPGEDAPKPSKDDPLCKNDSFRQFKCWRIQRRRRNIPLRSMIEYFRIFGLPGGRGGNGGDGGKGGKEGFPGKIAIIEMKQPSEITRLTSKGREGEIGKGGAGGQGGKNGGDTITKVKTTCDPACAVACCERSEWLPESTETIKNTARNDGIKGTDGRNGVGQQDPAPANGISGEPYIINEYRMFLRENINNRFNKFSLLQFLEQLNTNTDVRNLYDVLALIGEFQGLEEQFHKLSKQIDFSLFYNSLLDRINDFAKNLKEGPNSSENKKVLNYLYTATLGRIHNLRENSETSLIIDIRKYLELIKENIKTLKDLETQNNKVEVIQKYKENFKKGIDKKIEEAMSFIKNQVSPEIENINAKIDDQVSTLIEETIALQEEANKEIEKLAKKKKELEKSLALKSLFGCFQIIGGIVKFLGPIGRIAGTVMDAASAVGDALALNDQKKALNLPSDVASALKDIVDQIRSMRNKKVAYLQKLLDDLSEEIKKNPEKLSDMEDKINDIKDKLKKISENKLDYKQLKRLEKDLNKELKRKGDDLKLNPNDRKSVEALKVVEKIAKIIEFGSLLLSVYDKIKEERNKMGVVSDAMKELAKELKRLREYEEYIYDAIVPMLNEMIGHMKDISEKLGTKSQVALDVTKWQVQSKLKDMRLQMQRLTEGFSVKDDLSRSIEKLDEVMTTLIIIYDRIQSYQDQKNLADYIGDVSSVAAGRINIKNQQLVNAVNHLEYVMRANIVMEQYKSAIDALKQWVFPFADQYIENSMLPSQIEQETNIEDLVQNAARQIEAIKQKIDLYDASVKNGDEYLQWEEFSSRYVSSQPFFVWKNEDFGSLISNLLSGKEVILKADVKYSATYKKAIKFSEIDFYFKMKNETSQSQLTEILKGFDIRATHLGNSYYRWADKIFLITSDSVTISYSYEKNKDGIPIRSNKVYNTLKSGDLLLSPYTVWEARIINKTDQYSFEDLENFKNVTNLELSGFGSYVDSNAFRVPTNMSEARGVNEWIISKYRLARSVGDIVVDANYITNGASKGISSPINFICKFMKTYFVSNAITSIYDIFVGAQRTLKICDHCSGLRNEYIETKKFDPIDVSYSNIARTVTVDATSTEDECVKELFNPKSDSFLHVNFNGNSSCSKSFLLNDKKVKSNSHSTQIPDLNCSLLLADLVARTITGNRYKSAVEECLLSPREVILGKINNGLVRSESDLKQMLQIQLSEKDKRPISWFSKLDGYVKSMLQYLGLVGNEVPEEYVQDVRHLFA